MGALASSTRAWYCEQILKILRKKKKATAAYIVAELKKIPQYKYPISEPRIVNFLKYLKNIGLITYHRTTQRRIVSHWELLEGN